MQARKMADRFMNLKTEMSEKLDFTERINRLQDVTIEISYVNRCGVLFWERRIFATKLVIFA